MKGPKGGRRMAAAVATSIFVLSAGACGGPGKPESAKSSTTSTAPTSSTSSTTDQPATKSEPAAGAHHRKAALATHRVALCPLTGLPAPGGHVPQRAALAVKVENLPVARPQWGLDKADIVFEEPVEGGITRFIAVYDCQSADRIEPVRSVRLVDPKILEPLGRMLIAFSGGIYWAVSQLSARNSLLSPLSADTAGSAYWTDPDRSAPHNLETSTSALYAAAAAFHYPEKPPTAIFSYGPPVLGGYPAAVVNMYFPLDVTTWTWHKDTGLWYRSYSDTGPALQGDGVQITASNVVVLFVVERPTPFIEDDTGAHENDLALKGSGTAMVFRDGTVFYARWERPKLDDPAVFIDTKSGAKITLTPGNTWEELVPYGEKVAVSP